MPYARTSLRSEKRALRERMRGMGCDYREIAAEFARVFRLRPRAAWRDAYGWSLQESAGRINSYRGVTGLDSGGHAGMTASHLCEYENWPGQGANPTGRKPSAYLLAVLAGVYRCDVSDLVDAADREHLAKADLLILDTYVRPLPPNAGTQKIVARERDKEPNIALRKVREEERAETRGEFAEAMGRTALELGEDVCPDEKYVERLESGAISWPGPPYRKILSELCGRPIGELGFTAPGLSLSNSMISERGDSGDVTPARINVSLRNAILASGMEVSQLAHKVGVDPKTAQRWITLGRIPHPRHRWKTCQILGRDESELWPDPVANARTPESLMAARTPFSTRIPKMLPESGGCDVSPLLENIARATAYPVLAALKQVQQGYLAADQMIGALAVCSAVRTQIPLVEKVCEVTRGADRVEALIFACRFMEFCGWIHQDAGDLSSAMFWTDRALDYAMELADRRNIAYTLMRKAAIATEAGNPAQGLGISNFALRDAGALTPRLRAVILRQRAHAHAALRESAEAMRDGDSALSEAITGMSQGEEDRAPYCTPMYVAMETGQSMVVAGQPENALPVLSRSRSQWSDRSQTRDYALCVSRLATAYAATGEMEKACKTAEEAISLAQGMGSRRVIDQLDTLSRVLRGWQSDTLTTATLIKLNVLIATFRPK